MKLNDIADVFIGLTLDRKKSIDNENSHDYKLFSFKHYEEKRDYPIFNSKQAVAEKLIAKKEDLLIRLLYPNKIIYVKDNLEGLLIPSQFCIIRIKREDFNSIYIKWYLESEEGKQAVFEYVTGTIIQSLPVNSIKKIEIPHIRKDKQDNIKDLVLTWQEEKEKMKELAEIKENYYNHCILEYIKKGESHASNNK